MNIEITNIILDDLESIYKLGTGIDDFSADGGENIFWPKETLTRLFQSEDDVCMALRVNREIVGFSLTMIHPATKKAVLENFVVKDEYQHLAQEFLDETERAIEKKDAQFIAYFFDQEDDVNEKEFFDSNGYFTGNSHYWMHKNISFSNPKN